MDMLTTVTIAIITSLVMPIEQNEITPKTIESDGAPNVRLIAGAPNVRLIAGAPNVRLKPSELA